MTRVISLAGMLPQGHALGEAYPDQTIGLFVEAFRTEQALRPQSLVAQSESGAISHKSLHYVMSPRTSPYSHSRIQRGVHAAKERLHFSGPSLYDNEVMVGRDSQNIDCQHRPASVLVLDLVGHSRKDARVAARGLKMLESCFDRARLSLGITEFHFNHTGDGYVCAFLGNSSPRMLDFVNLAFPDLKRTFAPTGQRFRAGLDFGLLRLDESALTGDLEHFAAPGINASRLESSAEPDQILATELFHSVFAPLYKPMFSDSPARIATKDRELLAYEVTVTEDDELRSLLVEHVLQSAVAQPILPSARRKIMIVDDEGSARQALASLITSQIPDYIVTSAADGGEALELFNAGEYALILTDVRMAPIDGLELTRKLIEKDPKLMIMALTAFHSALAMSQLFEAGVASYCTKPFKVAEVLSEVRHLLRLAESDRFRQGLCTLTDQPGHLLLNMHNLRRSYRRIHSAAEGVNLCAYAMIRHKAKDLVFELGAAVQSRTGILDSAQFALRKMARLESLLQVARHARDRGLLVWLSAQVEDVNSDVSSDARIILNAPDEMPLISEDLSLILVLTCAELIDNAISAKRDCEVTVTLSVLSTRGMLQLSVHDNGPGVPDAMRDSIFLRGVSTKGPRRGLGLNLIQSAVETMGGKIAYEYLDGARFTCATPYNVEKNPTDPQRHRARGRILLIETDELLATSLKMLLEEEGNDVAVADFCDAAEKCTAVTPDLVLMHAPRPSRKDQCVPFLTQHSDKRSKLLYPLIVLDNEGQRARSRWMQLGALDVLDVPCDGDDLMNAVCGALSRRG